MSELDKMPEDARKALVGALMKSLGVGPIEADTEADDAFRVVALKADDEDNAKTLSGLMAHLIESATKRAKGRPATLAEVLDFNKAERAAFKVGDAVRWRPGQRNSSTPEDGETVIVSQVLDTPVYNGEPGSACLASRNDIALAFMHQQGGMPFIVEFLYDSRRFERVTTTSPRERLKAKTRTKEE